MRSLLATVALVASCAASQPSPVISTSVDDASLVFFVGDSKTQRMLPNVRLLLVSDGAPISEIGNTDVNGRASVPLSQIRVADVRVLLFCRDGFFCGAFRTDEPSFFEYREHFIQLAPFALR